MTARVVAGLRVVRLVAERPDPTEPVRSGAIAAAVGIDPTSASRLCADLEAVGYLERGGPYGAYRLGSGAIRLSGRASAGVSRAVRQALTIAAQQTGETACLAARTGPLVRVVASVGSEWTLHASADVGEDVRPDSALATVLHRAQAFPTEGLPDLTESTVRRVVEVAAPVLNPAGEVIAAVAVRLPTNRAARGVVRARRAVELARRTIEEALVDLAESSSADVGDHRPAGRLPTFTAASMVLDRIADRPDRSTGIASATGLRVDRVQRLVDACVRAGLVRTSSSGEHELSWGVHGWHRATTGTVLVTQGRSLVAAAAAATGTFGFITVLKGIRSFTVVEELDTSGSGLVMMPWLNRPHPVIGSDGGPSLVTQFAPEFLAPLLRKRHATHELETLFAQMLTVRRDGVLSIESIEEAGLISTSAPIHDASGSVVGAACLTGAADSVKGRVDEVKSTTYSLAADISAALGRSGGPEAVTAKKTSPTAEE